MLRNVKNTSDGLKSNYKWHFELLFCREFYRIWPRTQINFNEKQKNSLEMSFAEITVGEW